MRLLLVNCGAGFVATRYSVHFDEGEESGDGWPIASAW